MLVQLTALEKPYSADLSRPLDISIPLLDVPQQPNCFYAPPYRIDPVRAGDFVGDTRQGGAVNFFNIHLNPHGNGTHTECVGHIALERYSIRKSLSQAHHIAQLITLYPQKKQNNDKVITANQLEDLLGQSDLPKALIIRTMPNYPEKQFQQYSGTNPCYFEPDAIDWLVNKQIEHLLVDIPSVDREEDGGALASHKAFWKYPDNIREYSTITELIYVSDEIIDGIYLLNLQTASFELDVSPSKPVLYALMPM